MQLLIIIIINVIINNNNNNIFVNFVKKVEKLYRTTFKYRKRGKSAARLLFLPLFFFLSCSRPSALSIGAFTRGREENYAARARRRNWRRERDSLSPVGQRDHQSPNIISEKKKTLMAACVHSLQ